MYGVVNVPVLPSSLYGRLPRIEAKDTQGIQFFGKTYEAMVFESVSERLEVFKADFAQLIDATLAFSIFQYNNNRALLGEPAITEERGGVPIVIEARVLTASAFGEGMLPPYDNESQSVEIKTCFHPDDVTLRVLKDPFYMELAHINEKLRFMFGVYYELQFHNLKFKD